jgi:hypothetical protein
MSCRFPSREFSTPLLPCIFWTILLLSTPLARKNNIRKQEEEKATEIERESKIKASDCHSEELFFSGAGKNFIGLGILTDH